MKRPGQKARHPEDGTGDKKGEGCSAEHPSCGSAHGAAGKHGGGPGEIRHRHGLPVHQPGDGKEHGEIQNAREHSPEESAGQCRLAGQEAAEEAGDHIDSVYGGINLRFPQFQLVESKGKDQKKHPGQQIGREQRA